MKIDACYWGASAAWVALLLSCGGRVDGDTGSPPASMGGAGGDAGSGATIEPGRSRPPGGSGGDGGAAQGGAAVAGGADPGGSPSTGASGGTVATGGTPSGTGGAPSRCGNGRIEAGEMCDGPALGGEDCATATMGAWPEGLLTCTADCRFDSSRCTSDSPYTCLERQAAGEPPPPAPPITDECGAWDGGPLMGYCAPADLVVQGDGFGLPQDTCDATELCVPKTKIEVPGSCFAPCDSVFGDPGACVPSYVVEAPGSPAQGLSSVLGSATCAEGETCAPCTSPLDGTTTGACDA